MRGATLLGIRVASPFVVRTFDPPISAAKQHSVRELRRIGKRVALRLDSLPTAMGADARDSGDSSEDLWVVIHLMIAGRFRWAPLGSKIPGKLGLAAFDFGPRPEPTAGEPAIPRDAANGGTMILTEAASKKRASIHLVRTEATARAMDRGGIEPLDCSASEYRAALQSENHTLKRSLTDPRLFSGIGNAYSDEILHRARLSPVQLTSKLDDEEIARLHQATRTVLIEWTERLRAQAAGGFPEKVTAFRPEMAVHGKYRQPCPDCQTAVQRIAYQSNETDYCPRCQTGGRLLSDRSLARLLKSDWPKTIEELEEKMPTRAPKR